MSRRKRGASGSLPQLDPIPGTARFKQQQQQQQQRGAYPSSVPAWARPTNSTKASPASSRPRSPANEAADNDGEILALSAGCQPDEVYKETLSWSRYIIRKQLVKSLEWESPVLGSLQQHLRSSFWDAYFIWSSIFGTHSAFMVGLPIFWWFGSPVQGLGMVNILSAGVYISSFLKDLLCVPRPYTPPVERLSISSHGLEYGFPSTHSTNAVSISLYLAQIYLQSCTPGSEYSLTSMAVLSACALYATSVVAGRLYCGMHSMVDCLAGTLLGTAIWFIYYKLTPSLMHFLTKGSVVPSFVIPICLFLVSLHPEPVDDCPCFEDAIAFIATSAGCCLGQWTVSMYSLEFLQTLGVAPSQQALNASQLAGMGLWLASAIAKVAIGIGAIFIWRLAAKRVLYTILPPLFKLFQPIISLPRKGYETASGYQQIEDTKPMQPIPSLLDLTALGAASPQKSTLGVPPSPNSPISPSPLSSPIEDNGLLNVVGTASARPGEADTRKRSLAETANGPGRAKPKIRALYQIRYDVDVLTKVIVYAGIGYVVIIPMPILFQKLGLDV